MTQRVLAIVAEKTGYPPEMLEMDLDLEADLGVDTVKQAETFAAVREAYDIPRQESLKLRDFPTLKHVVQFVFDHRPDLAPAPAVAPAATLASAAPAATSPAAAAPAAAAPASLATASPAPGPYPLDNADRFPRRVPVPVLRPTLELCRATGVTLAAGSRVVIAADAGGVAQMLRRKLEKRGVTVVALDVEEPSAVPGQLAGVLADGSVDGVYWLPALDPEPALADMELAQFRAANATRVKSLHAAMRALYDSIGARGTFLVSATRMGGLFGCGAVPATAPLGGGVQGFTKAYKRERAGALVKVVDFALEDAPDLVATALLSETQADPGVVEVGYLDGRRYTLSLAERPAGAGTAGVALGRDSVFLVTGAAGGITSAIVADLAAASGGTFYLLDLVPLPADDDAHVALLRGDREQLKRALIEEARVRGDKPLPPAIERQILEVERRDAALRACQAVLAAGGVAHYRSVDLLDGAALAGVVDEIRERHGRLDVLLHAGGLEVSRDLPQKEAAEFARVFDVKADGFFGLLKATAGLPVGACVAFGSVAGRFGNAGQTDYAAGNALLCALTSHLAALRPETRAVAIDWTAWGGIGMATRGSIPKLMEAAGIELLPPEVGIPTVRRELVGGGCGEVVVAGRLGVMGAEWDAAGGLDLERANAALAAREEPLLMIGRLLAARLYGGLEAETTLDPVRQPFLHDHAMDGTPILPGVMAAEAFAELASVLVPDLNLVGVEDVVFDKPFKFYRNEPASFRVTAEAGPMQDGEIVVAARLVSLIQPKPELPAVEKEHFRARVRLARRAPRSARVAFRRPAPSRLEIDRDAIYSVYFHGPAYRVLERASVDATTAVGLLARPLPPNAAPPSAAALVEPRLVELCFQTAGLWELARERRLALPRGLRSVRVLRRAAAAGRKRLWAVAERQPDASFTVRAVDETGEVFVELVGYTSVTLEEGRSLP